MGQSVSIQSSFHGKSEHSPAAAADMIGSDRGGYMRRALSGAKEKLRANSAYIAAGFSGGVTFFTADLLIHPIDTIRARIQAESRQFYSLQSMARSMYADKGLNAFTRGISTTMFLSMTGNFFYFFAYDKLRIEFAENYPLSVESSSFFSSIVAMWLYTLVANPFELLRTRIQVGVSPQIGVFSGVASIFNSEGFAPFLGTYRMKFLYDTLGVAITFGLYEKFREFASPMFVREDGEVDENKYIIASAASFFSANVLVTLLSMPVSLLITRLQIGAEGAEGPTRRRQLSAMEVFRDIWHNEGARSLGKGWSARLIMTLYYSTFPMPVYEAIKLRLTSLH
eukprot:TRINITY_DN6397_c0_g1_i3.p1 TRINITY_DN6397_c0_g1~~TRINITY_DN6397_c0_g1_i3.p1  ORF type:complete len:339 (-),score=54.03 TRINITY_DN6397_c0_g1_i3:136-1152(-)